MTTPPPKRSIVLSYDETEDKLTICSVNDADIAPQLAHALKADWLLASINHEFTDSAAQRLGATVLSVLALYNPPLNPMLKVNLEPPELPE